VTPTLDEMGMAVDDEERPHRLAPLAKPADASVRAATILRHAVVGGDLVSGERLIPERIAEEIGISRPLVMTALRQLEHEGLVRIGGNGRPYVVGLASRYILDLYRFRFTLDQAVVAAIAKGIAPASIQELERIMELMEARAREGALTAFVDQDLAFHTTFLALADNPFLLGAWRSVSAVSSAVLTVADRLFALRPHIANVEEEMQRRARVRLHTQAALPQVLGVHEDILEGIRRGDQAGTLDALRRHYDNGEAGLVGQTRDLGLIRVVVDGVNPGADPELPTKPLMGREAK
jgi:DNA-binding GntR family transcriptional regulator